MTQQNLIIFDHPLISHKIALLRSIDTGNNHSHGV